MGAVASQITNLAIVYSTVYSGTDQRKKKLRVTGRCVGNSPVTGEFPAQMASNAENVSIWWRLHDNLLSTSLTHGRIVGCQLWVIRIKELQRNNELNRRKFLYDSDSSLRFDAVTSNAMQKAWVKWTLFFTPINQYCITLTPLNLNNDLYNLTE